MKRRFAILFTFALTSAVGATACGAAQEEMQKRAQEEVEKGRQQVEQRAQEERQKVEEQVKKKAQEGQKRVEEGVKQGQQQLQQNEQ